ncbi:putative bifunctional UDP-N-acetylmuramoylalanyl-D-glutamate--2,6-diaminopimelate ligase/UDP-N-acetylmuramoyl-tripeptide:D-alanyl-D-alanine ligase [compost metagenome]
MFTYGRLAQYIADEAQPVFPTGQVFSYQDKQELINALLALVKPDDVVLVKGSRGMRLEQVVHALLA